MTGQCVNEALKQQRMWRRAGHHLYSATSAALCNDTHPPAYLSLLSSSKEEEHRQDSTSLPGKGEEGYKHCSEGQEKHLHSNRSLSCAPLQCCMTL